MGHRGHQRGIAAWIMFLMHTFWEVVTGRYISDEGDSERMPGDW